MSRYGEWLGSWPTWAVRWNDGTMERRTIALQRFVSRLFPSFHRSIRSVRLSQVPPRHLGRRFQSQHPQHGGPDVAQGATVAQWGLRVVPTYNKERDRVRGVGGVRAVGRRIDHQLAIAVVRGDEQRGAGLLGGLHDTREAVVHGLHRPHRRA